MKGKSLGNTHDSFQAACETHLKSKMEQKFETPCKELPALLREGLKIQWHVYYLFCVGLFVY